MAADGRAGVLAVNWNPVVLKKNINLLNQALCHTSYTNENNLDVSLSYERLEFLPSYNALSTFNVCMMVV